MHLSISALALAILSFTSALPTPPHANPAFDPPTKSDSCPTLPEVVVPKSPIAIPADSSSTSKSPAVITDPSIDLPPSIPIKSRGTIRPSFISQYEVSTGAVHYQSPQGKISKNNGKTTDISTLLTFAIPDEAQGKTCSFHFDAVDTVSGTGVFDVFLSQKPASGNSESWPSGNLRDHHAGRMAAKSGAEAKWVSGHPAAGQRFPCPPAGKYGGELVGVGDVDHIEWVANTSGPYIAWE